MKTPPLVATLLRIAFVFCLLAPTAAAAQTWQWQFVVRTSTGAPVNTQSRVVLSPDDLSLSYTAHVHNMDVPIASCHVDVSEIANAQTVKHDGRTFLLVKLKPQHAAMCDNGSEAVAVTPVADDASLGSAVSAINHACCTPSSVALASPVTAPRVTIPPSPTPAPSPSPSPTAPPVHLTDWVVTDGLFAFVRIRNRDTRPATISGGAIQNCRNVDVGCGKFPDVTLAPGASATLATVMSNAQGDPATFTYRYTAQDGAARTTDGGTSSKAAVGYNPPMSPQDVRAAEAEAVASLGRVTSATTGPASSPAAPPAPTATPPPAFVAAQLKQRGTSRLAIGHTGVAMVRVSVSADGTPQNAQIVRISNRQLAAAAIETAVSSTYTPAMRYGHPVDGTYIATFRFDGDDPSLSAIPVWERDPIPVPAPASAVPTSAAAPVPAAPSAATPVPAPTSAAAAIPSPAAPTAAPTATAAPAPVQPSAAPPTPAARPR